MSFSHNVSGNKPSRRSGASAELYKSTIEMENAVVAIIDAVDHIFEFLKTKSADADKAAIRKQCTRIMEACTFQDIVGQRLVKVSKILSYLEGEDGPTASIIEPPAGGGQGRTDPWDSPPLDGPALSGEGLRQEDVERIWDAHSPANTTDAS